MLEFLFSFLEGYGLIALFLGSFASNFLLLPAFVELSCIIFLSLNFPPLQIFLSLLFGSVLGGSISYSFGFFGSRHVLKYKERIKGMENLIKKYGKFSVFLASFLPIPFPFALFAMLVGFLKMSIRSFLLAFIAGKALRIGLALFVLTWGMEILRMYRLI